MKKWIGLVLLAGWLLAVCGGRAEEPEMWIRVSGSEVLPGNAVIVSMSVPEAGVCTIRILDEEGVPVATVTENRPVAEGYNAFYWNGTWQGAACPEGQWRMLLEAAGRTAETPVTVGRMIPCVISAALDRTEVQTGKNVSVVFCVTEAGRMDVSLRRAGTEGNGSGTEAGRAGALPDPGESEAFAYSAETEAGDRTVTFPAAAAPGEYEAVLTLTREDGMSSIPVKISLTVTAPGTKYNPLYTSPYEGTDHTLNGWTVPMDITDGEAVWQALMAPVTVVDDGKSTDQRRQMTIRKDPSEDSEGVGVVTMISQGVHVLEKGEEWSLIECYSSSFHNSAVLNWNALVRGYVPTKALREVTPDPRMGIVVDKLTQRLYIFVDGELYSTLMVSTGKMNPKQPYNETRSGEYLLVSKVGGFWSDNYYCPLGIRFNAGDILHEVPYVHRSMDYSLTEPKLGSKDSHGCIRVQRKASPEGVNMQWIWNHYRKNTKILIWEDWQGRQVPVPEDDAVFYTNIRKNNYYHSSKNCSELGTRFPREITYAELSGEAGEKLKSCPYCGPAAKKSELEAFNAVYAEGGDHEPDMTEARESCPRKQK